MIKNDRQATLEREWHSLHNHYEQSERLALGIKLLAIVLCLVGFIASQSPILMVTLLLLLWLQESIWKTFQFRSEQRLLELEKAWQNNEQSLSMGENVTSNTSLSLYSQWAESKASIKARLAEYLFTAIRPTIAYPYVLLIIMTLMIPLSV